jgi:hypothetical protein
MADDDTSTHKLRTKQRQKEAGERAAEGDSLTPDEEHQHRRRADKAAYLEEKLAERERSERESG